MSAPRAGTAAPRRRAARRPPLRPLLTGALLALVAAGPSGCGDDDRGEAAVVRSGRSIEVVAREYSFEPEAIVVERGGAPGRASFEVALRNGGALGHNLRVEEGKRAVGGVPTILAGQRSSTRLSIDAGEYRFVCTVDGHEERGMVGTLRVR